MRYGGPKALLLVLGLTLSGCGGDEEESERTAVPTTTSSTSTTSTTTTSTTTTVAPTTTAAARRAPATTRAPSPSPDGGGGGAANCSGAYPDFCMPPAPPDLDCPDVGRRNFTVRPPDPHRFDADGDGVGCES